ncbi:hypothetical protein [uncultured Bacteroides sp.]|uniref:hypothetical protein n=1 Tax=uncultured Bacteroides sp. TaxID=162156 RepID=UPI00262F06F5|nr:hypothetical protein [uncultured Bacteroides sp.]
MKGIFPVWCRIAGYALLILSVFIPMLMYLFQMVDDSNLVYIKLGMKFVIWVSLFGIFLAKTKDESEVIAGIRNKAMRYGLYLWGIYYIIMLVKGALDDNLQVADNSVGIVFMVILVLCLEFFLQKHRIEERFKRK